MCSLSLYLSIDRSIESHHLLRLVALGLQEIFTFLYRFEPWSQGHVQFFVLLSKFNIFTTAGVFLVIHISKKLKAKLERLRTARLIHRDSKAMKLDMQKLQK
jgi:hypothetical protein